MRIHETISPKVRSIWTCHQRGRQRGRVPWQLLPVEDVFGVFGGNIDVYIIIRATPGVCPGVTLTIRASTIINYHGINYHHFRVKVLGFRF